MKTGKISESVWKRSVLLYTDVKANEILSRPFCLGNDCTKISAPGMVSTAYSVDTLFLKGDTIRQNGICRTVNNLAAAGMKTEVVLADILLPADAEEEQLKKLVQQLTQCTEPYEAAIAAGNVLVTEDVVRPVVTLTGIGTPMFPADKQQKVQQEQNVMQPADKQKQKVQQQKVRPGMDIVLSKWIGLEGSVLLLEEAFVQLQARFAAPFLEEAKGFVRYLSVVEEAAAAMKSGAGAMHNVSEGGIFGALWEMAEASGVGLEIDLRKIPLRQHTVEICEALGLNPYGLISGGCLLMAAENGAALAADLKKQNIAATVIGRATRGKARILYNDGETRYLERPQQDEWYRFLGKEKSEE